MVITITIDIVEYILQKFQVTYRQFIPLFKLILFSNRKSYKFQLPLNPSSTISKDVQRNKHRYTRQGGITAISRQQYCHLQNKARQ